ncbi:MULTISPECIES: hypothetical protein [unclassified Sphingomonas]|uniref:hypothetical protein n=1 Tax=unclassified Sphingomonas TaxID=196159 RepID=UPI000ABBF17A|nr:MULTISPECIES: hypothetical protein [unclassified Sphingomonas]
MTDIKGTDLAAETQVAKQQWQTPDFEVLGVGETANNGLTPPGDDIFSPSPTGS